MKSWALVGAKQPLQAIEVETPQVAGTEVLVQITHCGVCHTDLHFWEGEFNLGRGKKITLADRGTKLPLTLGHEIVGRVAAFGREAVGVKIGDRRIVYPWIGCGRCARCKAGDENLCSSQMSLGIGRDGGFATHVVIPHPRYLFEFGSLDPALASTFACSGITVFGAIRKLGRIDPDDAVLIVGAGGLGHAAISALIALGHRNIIVAEIDEAKRRAALGAGATNVVDAASGDVSGRIIEAAGGPLFHAIDFVNNTTTASFASGCLGKGGTLVLVGVAGGEMDISLARMVFDVRCITGTNTGSLQDLADVVLLAQSGKLKPIPVSTMPMERADDALQKLHAGGVTGRLVLENPDIS